MKSVIASLVAVAGMSVAAVAEVNTRMDVLVSLDGINWAPSVNANTGTTVQVLVRASYIGGAQPLGFASAVFQPTVSSWDASDVALAYAGGGFGSNTTNPANMVPAGAAGAGQYGRVSPMGRTNLTSSQAITNFVHTGGAGGAPAGTWLRIAQKQITSWIGGTGNTTGGSGVNTAQLNDNGRTTADPAFSPALQNVELFRFGVTIGAINGRTQLDIDLPSGGFGNRNSTTGDREVYWFATMVEGSGSIRGTATVNQGHIVLIPAPASMALLGLGGLCVARRRR